MDMKLAQKFERLGARVKFDCLDEGELRLDIRRDEEGEFFDLRFNPQVVSALQALDVRPRDRHLLLMARLPEQPKELQKHLRRFWRSGRSCPRLEHVTISTGGGLRLG